MTYPSVIEGVKLEDYSRSGWYVSMTYVLWALMIAYDVASHSPIHEVSGSNESMTSVSLGYIGGHAFGMVQYLVVYLYCENCLRREFCLFVLKGGLLSVAFAFVVGRGIISTAQLYGDQLAVALTFEGAHLAVSIFTWFFSALVEEFGKLAVFTLSLRDESILPGQVRSAREVLFLSGAVGLGFQMIENELYLRTYLTSGILYEGDIYIGGFLIYLGCLRTLPMMHVCWIASSALRIWKTTLSRGESPTIGEFFWTIIVSSLLHFSWNTLGYMKEYARLASEDVSLPLLAVLWIISAGVAIFRYRRC